MCDELRRLRWERAGLSAAQAAALLGVSVRRFRQWEAGTAPAFALLALRFLAGEIGAPSWAGWLFGDDGRLYGPHSPPWSPADLYAAHWRYQQIGALTERVRLLERECVRLAAEARAAGPAAANEGLYWLAD